MPGQKTARGPDARPLNSRRHDAVPDQGGISDVSGIESRRGRRPRSNLSLSDPFALECRGTQDHSGTAARRLQGTPCGSFSTGRARRPDHRNQDETPETGHLPSSAGNPIAGYVSAHVDRLKGFSVDRGLTFPGLGVDVNQWPAGGRREAGLVLACAVEVSAECAGSRGQRDNADGQELCEH